MKLSETEIENQLRNTSPINPPADLRAKLVTQIRLPANSDRGPVRSFTRAQPLGWRRWFMILAPSAVCLACVVVLAVQQMDIQDLRSSIEALTMPEPVAASMVSPPGRAASKEILPQVPSSEAVPVDEGERLTAIIQRLRQDIQVLELLQKQNADLKKKLLTPALVSLTPEELAEIDKARERARSINCVNNMKQMGLAVRVWALDNQDIGPPDIVCMSNELSTPKILVCPSDTNRVAAHDFNSFTMANFSYEFLAPNASDATDPQRLLFRCPIHGHIGLCDGSVQMEVAKKHPDWLVERDGKLFYEHDSSPQPATPIPVSQ
jgi:hypothetical protein